MWSRLKNEFSFMHGNLLTLIITWLFFFFAYSVVAPFESPYIRELGASPTTIGLMGSVGAAVFVLVQIPGAYIADKYGRKQIIVTMTFALSFSYIFYAIAPDWRFVLIGMLVANLTSIYQPALTALEADSIHPEKRGMGYAAVNVIPRIPTVFAPALAGLAVEQFGLVPGMRVIYLLVFVCIIVAASVRMLFLKETVVAPRLIVLKEITGAFRASFRSMIAVWKIMPSSLKFLTVARLLSAFEEPIWFTFMALYVFDVVGVSVEQWAFVNVVYVAVIIVLGFPLGKLVDRMGRKKILAFTYFFIFTPFIIFFIFSRDLTQLLLAYILFAVGRALVVPAYGALQADIVPRDMRGRVLGGLDMLNVLAIIPASAIGGVLYDANPSFPFFLSLVFAVVVGLVIVLAVKEPLKREI
jgi:DHA1 family tetracycline resistance protein-like MFS transporter